MKRLATTWLGIRAALALACNAAVLHVPAATITPAIPSAARPQPLSAIHLTSGPVKNAQDLDAKYLLALEPDRLLASPLLAQDAAPYKGKPKNHDKNQQLAARAYEGNLKKYAHDHNILVLPGLVADKAMKRVEMMVERTAVGPNAPCEFTIIAETSDHAYEALLISFAKPSDVHRALQFIGTEPGESFDPGSLRFWAKGESFVLSIVKTNEPPLRLEELLVDQRTGKSLREEGFMFTGSRREPALNDPQQQVYAADEYQPKSIVSLFNSTYSVLEVPYSAPKEVVYQNTTVNPEHELPEGSLLTLLIEPVNKDDSKRVKDLVLHVQAGAIPTNQTATDVERLTSLSLQLKDSETVLNGKPTLISVIETLAALDRKKHDYYLTVRFGDSVDLGQAQALARILSSIDSEKGIRIDPPPAGQIYYRAFTPDQQLLDREARLYHPWELSLAENDGQIAGKLLLIDSVWKQGAAASELEITELPVSGPQNLRRELDAEIERAKKAGKRAKAPAILVFAPSNLQYGQLTKFLGSVLPTHKMVHVYLDIPLPSIPKKRP